MGTLLGGVYTLWNQIVYAISNIRVFDIVDILLVALILYKAMEFLRETRSGQLVKGIAVLIIVYLLANWFKLAVMRWLLSAVVDSIIIALAIIFQPEIRRILERVGQANFGKAKILDDETQRLSDCIDAVCKAAGLMQENKIGALIVFERKTQLGEIIDTGTIIDAVSSVSMVNNVFYPKSPLHDGALIIRNGRLYAAGCILPLTQTKGFSSHLGTRHRAAIGMTENSDATVVVVSEETGNISVVYDGEMTRNYNAVSLCTELKRQLIDSELEERDNIAISAFKNLIPKFGRKNKTEEK